jgi:signal transduction histidine kinase
MVLAQGQRTACGSFPTESPQPAAAREKPPAPRDDHDPPAERSPASLRVFAGGLAHSFNNLLTVILGNSALLREQLTSNLALLNLLHEIETAAYRAENLTRQMLLYAQKTVPHLDVLSLNRLMEELEDRLKSIVPSNVAVVYDLSADLPKLRGDRVQLRRLLASLVNNGAEAMNGKPGVVRVQARAIQANHGLLASVDRGQELAEGQYIWLQVSDNGCGMDEDTQQHIFEPFFTTKFVGRGLGLSAALGIVRQHLGAIWVASRPTKGTTVHVLLPCGTEDLD